MSSLLLPLQILYYLPIQLYEELSIYQELHLISQTPRTATFRISVATILPFRGGCLQPTVSLFDSTNCGKISTGYSVGVTIAVFNTREDCFKVFKPILDGRQLYGNSVVPESSSSEHVLFTIQSPSPLNLF